MTAEPERSPSGRSRVLVGAGLVAAAAFVGLALLVTAGKLDGVDSFAVHHLAPARSPHEAKTSLLGYLLSYHGHSFHFGAAVKLPASILLSSMIVAVACLALWRRGHRESAALWMSAFVAAIAVELVFKRAITRPTLSYATIDHGLIRLTSLESSFPSGHAVRAAMLVTVVAFTWPSLRPLVFAWLAGLVLILELYGIHTPSDILGGLLLAAALILFVVPLTRTSRVAGRGSHLHSHARAKEPASLRG